MKRVLVIGLGNDLVGDDGIGCRLVELLSHDGELSEQVEFAIGGSDLLSMSDRMEGRERVILIDAVLGDEEPGTVSTHEEPFDAFDLQWGHAHAPSALQAVELLKAVTPALRETSFTLIGIAVPALAYEGALRFHDADIAGRVRQALASTITAC